MFEAVSFTLAAGQSLALLGPHGPSQTLLARTLALIERPRAGRVLVEGEEYSRAWGQRLRTLRRTVQYIGGNPRRSLSPRLTVQAILAEPLQVHGLGSAAERGRRVAGEAETWQLNHYLLGLRPAALSAALCLRVALARAHLLRPRLLVCDDIGGRLEPAGARAVLARLAAICRAEALGWLWMTSDPALAEAFADRVLVLEAGQVAEAA